MNLDHITRTAYGYITSNDHRVAIPSPPGTGTFTAPHQFSRIITHPENPLSLYHESVKHLEVVVDFEELAEYLGSEIFAGSTRRRSSKAALQQGLTRNLRAALTDTLMFSPRGEHWRATEAFKAVEQAACNVRTAVELSIDPADMEVLRKYDCIEGHYEGGYAFDGFMYELPDNGNIPPIVANATRAFRAVENHRDDAVDSLVTGMTDSVLPMVGEGRFREVSLAKASHSKLVAGLKSLPPEAVAVALQRSLGRPFYHVRDRKTGGKATMFPHVN